MITVLFIISATPIFAKQLPKLLLLKFNNIDENADFSYLESTLTDVLREQLKKRYVYQEVDKKNLSLFMRDNYFVPKEQYTVTSSMKLGLELNQDVVISGGFKIAKSKDKSSSIQVTVRIYDISNKKIVSEIVEQAPVDSTIFAFVDKLGSKIATSAKQVLPSQEEWEKKGYNENKSNPIFSDVSLQFAVGGGLMFGGWSEYFDVKLPAFVFSLRSHVPIISKELTISGDLQYLRTELKEGDTVALQQLDVAVQTTNLFSTFYVGYEIPFFFDFLSIEPKIGAGYLYQITDVVGEFNATANGGKVFGSGALDFYYTVNKSIDIYLANRIYADFEKDVITYNASSLIGVGIKF